MINPNATLNGVLLASADRLKKNVPAAKRQIVCTRGVFPTGTEGGNNSTHTRFESHIKVNTGSVACTSLQLHYPSYRSREAEDGVLSIGNFDLQACVVYDGKFFPCAVNGTTTTPVVPFGLVLTAPLGMYIPANAELTLKTGAITAVGNTKVPGGLSQTGKLKKVASTSASSVIFSASDVGNTDGRTNTTLGFFPFMVTGIPKERHIAIAGWGDSLMEGVGDATDNANGAAGWFEHACLDLYGTGQHVPFVNLSKSASTAVSLDGDKSPIRFAALDYVTHVIFGLGNNDIAAGRTLEQIKASHTEAWTHAKLYGCRVGAVTLTPRTTSTDSWATVANQTPVSGYTTAGIRGQFNAWLVQQKALGNLDFIVDVNSVAADTTNPDVFKAGFSYDGTHWGAASTLTVAAYAKTIFLKLEV